MKRKIDRWLLFASHMTCFMAGVVTTVLADDTGNFIYVCFLGVFAGIAIAAVSAVTANDEDLR